MHFVSGRTGVQTAFERFNIRESDGSFYHITPHQFRHYLNDLAAKGGMHIDIQTRWMGRTNPWDTEAYLHESPYDFAKRVRQLSEEDEGEVAGAVVDFANALPIEERAAFLEGEIRAVHRTPFGGCTHDFGVEPCEYHIHCVRGYGDYIRQKGNQRERTQLLQIRDQTKQALNAAKQAAQDGTGVEAEAWIRNCEELLAGVEAVLAIDDDPSVADGAPALPFEGQPSRYQPE